MLLSENHELLYEFYASNKGQPLDCIQRELSALYEGLSPDCTICGSAVTGYGEDLIRAGLGVDFGIVETVAHFKAASFFCPEVDLSSTSADRISSAFRSRTTASTASC